MYKPRQPHLDATHRVLRYLKGTPALGLFILAHSDFHIKDFMTLTEQDVWILEN